MNERKKDPASTAIETGSEKAKNTTPLLNYLIMACLLLSRMRGDYENDKQFYVCST